MRTLPLLLILISLTACFEKPDQRVLSKAEQALENGDNQKAAELFRKLKRESSDLRLQIKSAENLVYIYESAGDYEKSVGELNYIALHAQDRAGRVRAKQQMADSYFFKLKNYQEALTHYYELIAINFNQHQNQLMVAKCYYFLNNLDQARFEVQTLIDGTKNKGLLFEGHLLKGHILFAQKHYREAADTYQNVIKNYEKMAKESHVLLHLAMSFEESSQYSQAISALEKLRESYHSPDFISAKISHIRRKMGLVPTGKGWNRR
ncbi:MAG: tetratricopeptide repeat protein [Bdellovibrionales bacterium]|nr:tetratricopeptide repeat protein [Bdellovibrionales bacterium]